MKVAIMQPYFLPYIGYFQLMQAVDVFVVYDNIKYTKAGWINRNRYLQNGTDALFSLPLRRDSDFLDVVEREIAADFNSRQLLDRLLQAYRKAPQLAAVTPVLERVLGNPERNLFSYIRASLNQVRDYLAITTPLVVSSTLPIDHTLKAQDKVIAICKELGATNYINAIGGLELYDRAAFAASGIALHFIKSRPWEYPQLGNPFVPWLSILDVMMFNLLPDIRTQLASGYELV